jgi:hypothetical protein
MRAFAISSAKALRLGPTVRDTGRGRAGHRNLRDVRGTEHRFDDGHGGAALDACAPGYSGCSGVLSIGCQVARVPGRVAVEVAVADRG